MALALSPRATNTVAVVGGLAITTYAALTAWAAGGATYEVWSALVFVPLLVLLTVPMLVRAGRRDPDPRFLRILAWAFALKCLATVARYLMAFVLYDGVADASGYDGNGTRLAAEYRAGNLDADIGRDFVGTGFIRVLTGAIYTVTGPSVFVAYAVFSWLGFWGLYFLYRAFRVGVPDGDAHRYAFLVLLLPSMLFWPSGLGKEAFMTFGIGLAAYGGAMLVMGYRRWMPPLLFGLLAASVVRPHIAAALFAALGVAYLLRRLPGPANELTPLKIGLATALIGAGGLVAVSQAADFLGVDKVTAANVDAALSETAHHTGQGGSEYEANGVDHLADLPVALFSVLFRPMVFEAGNAQMLLAAAEGTVLLVLLALAWRSLGRVPTRLRRQPYLIFCLVYILLFVYAFSSFGNFGILTRERVQVMPLVLVFLALRPPRLSEELPPSSTPAHQGAHR